MEETIEIKIPGNPKFLKLVRHSVQNLCTLIGFSARESNHITLAIDEACSNIIRHAYGGKTQKPIILKAIIMTDRIRFLIYDQGKAATPDAFQSRNLDEIRPGGLGVHLIKSVMDKFEYHHLAEMNELILEKNISHPVEV
jgi:anti-sigma regulatory factor (Ser/Thr protein kinase)